MVKLPVREKRIYRGREYTAYLMDRKFFSLLSMRFRGKKALEWQVKFNDAFYNMEKMLLTEALNKQSDQWLENQKRGDLSYIEDTGG